MQMLFVVFVVLCAIASAQIPIPRRYDGFYQGNADAPILLEAFIDFLCPDCQQAWPNLKSVVAYYNNATLKSNNMRFVVHGFPLPYHSNSFFATQATHAIAAKYGYDSKQVFDWIDGVYNNLDSFGNDDSKTPGDVKQSFADLAKNVGLDGDVVLSGFKNGQYNMDTRISWKYGCSRTVSGTPTFFVNGVNVAGDPSWSLSDWRQVLDPLLAPSDAIKTLRYDSEFTLASSSKTESSTCPSGTKECHYLPGKVMCCHSNKYCIPNVGCTC